MNSENLQSCINCNGKGKSRKILNAHQEWNTFEKHHNIQLSEFRLCKICKGTGYVPYDTYTSMKRIKNSDIASMTFSKFEK